MHFNEATTLCHKFAGKIYLIATVPLFYTRGGQTFNWRAALTIQERPRADA